MELIQIIIAIFALFALSRIILRRKDRSIALGLFLFWSIVWAGIFFFALFPDIATRIASKSGFGRTLDFLMLSAIIALFYLSFRIYVKVEKQSQEITRLVRALAVEKAINEERLEEPMEEERKERRREATRRGKAKE